MYGGCPSGPLAAFPQTPRGRSYSDYSHTLTHSLTHALTHALFHSFTREQLQRLGSGLDSLRVSLTGKPKQPASRLGLIAEEPATPYRTPTLLTRVGSGVKALGQGLGRALTPGKAPHGTEPTSRIHTPIPSPKPSVEP